MFCAYCGVKIINPNQKYCHNCGKAIEDSIISKTLKLRNEGTQYTSPAVSASTSRSANIPNIQNILIKNEDRPGPLSVKSFVFSLVSIGLAILSSILGGGVFLFLRIFSFRGNFFKIMNIIIWIIVIIIQFAGIIFGIQSRKNSFKAINMEPRNTIERLGNIFGIIGIIANAIALGLSLFIFPLIIYLVL